MARWAVGGARGRKGERGAENGVNEDEDGKWRAEMWGNDGVNVGCWVDLGRIWGVFRGCVAAHGARGEGVGVGAALWWR